MIGHMYREIGLVLLRLAVWVWNAETPMQRVKVAAAICSFFVSYQLIGLWLYLAGQP